MSRSDAVASKPIHTVAEVLASAEKITEVEGLEDTLLTLTQQAQEVIVLIEDEDYTEAKTLIDEIEAKFNAVRDFVHKLEAGEDPSKVNSTADDEDLED